MNTKAGFPSGETGELFGFDRLRIPREIPYEQFGNDLKSPCKFLAKLVFIPGRMFSIIRAVDKSNNPLFRANINMEYSAAVMAEIFKAGLYVYHGYNHVVEPLVRRLVQ